MTLLYRLGKLLKKQTNKQTRNNNNNSSSSSSSSSKTCRLWENIERPSIIRLSLILWICIHQNNFVTHNGHKVGPNSNNGEYIIPLQESQLLFLAGWIVLVLTEIKWPLNRNHSTQDYILLHQVFTESWPSPQVLYHNIIYYLIVALTKAALVWSVLFCVCKAGQFPP